MVKRYDQEFKEMLVQLYESGQGVTALSSEYGVAETTIYKWIDKYAKKGGEASKADILALKRQMARLDEENRILKKALTIFARKEK